MRVDWYGKFNLFGFTFQLRGIRKLPIEGFLKAIHNMYLEGFIFDLRSDETDVVRGKEAQGFSLKQSQTNGFHMLKSRGSFQLRDTDKFVQSTIDDNGAHL